MTHTSPSVSFGIGYALEIKQDSIPSAPDLQPFSNILDLRTDNATNRPYATYEPDFWLLDGEYRFLPDNLDTVHIGMMSTAMSGGAGAFAVPPVLTINFGVVHSLDSLTLKFAQYSDDYADDIDVAFYDDTNTLIQTDNYTPTSWEFSTGQAIDDFKKIIITFNSTNRAYRYLRLTGIDYGPMITFTDADIKAASVIENTSILSTEVIIHTLNLRLYSADAEFSLINPTGDYASLAQRQPLSVYETVGNQSLFIGQYYLDTWENQSDTVIEFSCIDLVGVLDTMTYKGGIWLGAGIALEDLLEDILAPIFAPYDLEGTLYGTVVIGWIPICTYREALQQIAFAVGAYVDCSRDRPIKIYPSVIASASTDYDTAITKAEKGANQSLSLKPMVTGVEVTAHDLIEGTGNKKLYDGVLTVGTHEITFSQPMHDLTITGATITESGANYALLDVTTEGTVVLSGLVYVDTRRTYSVYTPGLTDSIKLNILKVEDATLVNSGNATAVTQRIYDYYQQRYFQKVKLYASLVAVGDTVLVDALYNEKIRGLVEKMEIDLAMGFIAQCEVVGVEHVA